MSYSSFPTHLQLHMDRKPWLDSPLRLRASPMYSTEPSVAVHCDELFIAVTRCGNYQCVESALYNPTSPTTLRQTQPDLTVTSLCPRFCFTHINHVINGCGVLG